MRLFSSIAQDLRLAVRQARRTPVVSSVALLSLALGIGANVAIFSLVNALILRPLPVADRRPSTVNRFSGALLKRDHELDHVLGRRTHWSIRALSLHVTPPQRTVDADEREYDARLR